MNNDRIMESGFEYYAFISYKREDEKWAKWLQKEIEGYRLPTAIKRLGSYPRKLKPVFLDTTDIQPGLLKAELKEKLEKSKYLIVICSPLSAKSKWVGEEIAHFISLGRANSIIPVIIAGVPYSDDLQIECFHPNLKEGAPEYLGVNINEEKSKFGYIRREKAFIRVMSKMLDVAFDTLWQRHRRRKIKQAISVFVFTLFVLAAMAGIWRYHQPFAVHLTLDETTLPNEKLGFPDKGGEVAICYNERDTLVKTVKNLNDTICFNDIPGRYRGTKSKLIFRLWGFADVDTVMSLQPEMTLPVKRDDTYGRVQGYVRNTHTDLFVEGVTIEVADQAATTDKNGYFVLDIPLKQQQKSYDAKLTHKEKAQRNQKVYPTQKEESLVNTLYVE